MTGGQNEEDAAFAMAWVHSGDRQSGGKESKGR